MISLAKRNSSTVAIAKKEVLNCLNSGRFKVIKHFYFDFYGEQVAFGTFVSTPVTGVSINNLLIEESKNKVILGLDLSCVSVTLDTDFNVLLSSLSSLPDKFFSDSENLSALSSWNRYNFIKSSAKTAEAKRLVSEIISSKRKAVLKDGEFPSIKNREMLPILTLDFDKREVSYYQNNRPNSYRKDINRCGFSWLFQYKLQSFCIPLGLISITFEHKNFKAESD